MLKATWKCQEINKSLFVIVFTLHSLNIFILHQLRIKFVTTYSNPAQICLGTSNTPVILANVWANGSPKVDNHCWDLNSELFLSRD